MKPLTCCVPAIVLLAASAAMCADVKSEAAARAKAVAPFVTSETMAVAHLDFTRMSPQRALDLLVQVLPISSDTIEWAKEETLKEWKTAMAAGVKDIYVVVSPGREGWMPRACGIIPMLPNADEKAMRVALKAPADYGRFLHGAYVVPFPPCFFGSSAKPPEFQPAERAELVEAFQAAGDSAIQVAVIPPAYTSRVIEELMPQFPKVIGGGPTTILTRGLIWAAVGIDLQPQLTVHLTIKSADAQAADALRMKMAEVVRLAGQYKEVRAVVPKYDELPALLAPKLEGDRLVLILDQKNQGAEKLVSLLTQPIEVVREKAARLQSINNLKQIGLAIHNYAAAHKHFPLPASYSKDGKPLLSWRVHILPYLEGDALYKQFHLDEPWDSPHNRTLIDKMPSIYRLPLSKTEKGRTNYLLPVGGGAVFQADQPTFFKDITDGTSNTIMSVEVDDDHAVIWTKPEDLQFDPKDPTRGLGRFFDGSFSVGVCDGSVRWVEWPKDAKEIEKLRYLFQRADHVPVAW